MSFDIEIYKNGFKQSSMISDAESFTKEAFTKYHPGNHLCAEFVSTKMEEKYDGKWNCFIFPDSNGSSKWYADLWIRFIVKSSSLEDEKYHVVIFKN